MFIFISIFFIPVMSIYNSNRQHILAKQAPVGGYPYTVSELSLGNLGGSNVNCH